MSILGEVMRSFDEHVKSSLNDRLKALEIHFDSDVIFFYGPIYPSVEKIFRDFIERLKDESKDQERITVFLNTGGGVAETVEKLVEIIPCLTTTMETLSRTKELLIQIEREIIEVKIDTAGFVMNRIYLAAAGEAIRLYARGVATVEDIKRIVSGEVTPEES